MRRKALPLRGLACLLVAAGPAWAAGNDDEASLLALLDTPITTASKVAQKSGDAPATVVVVTEEQIRRRGYRSLIDVFKDLPDFKVELRSDPEWYNDVTVRGIPGHDKFVLLMDGVRVSAPTNELLPLLENYPVHLAKQIEVVYGPASALYGADAVAGVVNIITRDSGSVGEATVALGDNSQRFANAYWAKEFGTTRVVFAGQWMHDPEADLDSAWHDDYKGYQFQQNNSFPTQFGPQSAVTAYDKTPGETVLTNAVYVGLKSDHFRFSVFRNSSRTPSANIYSVENSIHNDQSFIGHGLTVVSGQYNFDAGPFSFQSTLTASNYQLDPYSSFRNMFTGMEPGYKYAESQSSKGEQQVVWSASSKLTVTGGFSYETAHAIPWSTDLQDPMDTKSSIRGKIRGTPFDADFFSVHYTNTAAYLQIQWTPVESFSATVGGRYDYNSRYGSTTNPRLGLVYHAGKAGTFKLLYGQSFLAPSPLLAYSHFGSFFSTDGGNTWQSFFWRLPNPNLKPMESKSLELSYRVLLSDSVAVSAVLYQNKLKNLFSLGYTSNETYKGWNVATVERRINLGTEKLNGGTVQLDYSRSFGSGTRIGANVSYSFVDGKVDPREDGHEIEAGLIAPKTMRAGLDLGWGPWTFTPRYTKVGEQRLDDTYTDAGGGVHRYTLDGYGNLDFTLRFLGVPHAEFFARVSNATDARYRNINHEWKADGSTGEFKGAPQDPRRWSVGVTARF